MYLKIIFLNKHNDMVISYMITKSCFCGLSIERKTLHHEASLLSVR